VDDEYKYQCDNVETRVKLLKVSYALLSIYFLVQFVLPLIYVLFCFVQSDIISSLASFICFFNPRSENIGRSVSMDVTFYLGFSLLFLAAIVLAAKPHPEYFKEYNDCEDTFRLYRSTLIATIALLSLILVAKYIDIKTYFHEIATDSDFGYILVAFFTIILVIPAVYILLIVTDKAELSQIKPAIAITASISLKIYFIFSTFATGYSMYALEYGETDYHMLDLSIWGFNLLYILLIFAFAGGGGIIGRVLIAIGGITMALGMIFYVYLPAITLAAYYTSHWSIEFLMSIGIFALAFASYTLVIFSLVLLFFGGSIRAKLYLFLNYVVINYYVDLYVIVEAVPCIGEIILISILLISQVIAYIASRNLFIHRISNEENR